MVNDGYIISMGMYVNDGSHRFKVNRLIVVSNCGGVLSHGCTTSYHPSHCQSSLASRTSTSCGKVIHFF